MGALTADKVRRLGIPGRYTDGGGLHLVIHPGGSKSWVLRVQRDGKRVDRGLGGYPACTLAVARSLAEDQRVAIRQGAPLTKPKRTNANAPAKAKPQRKGPPTFEGMARKVHAMNLEAGVWCPENATNWIHRAEKHLFPIIGHLALDRIPVNVLRDDLLRPVALTKSETAKRLRIILRQTFEVGVEDGLIDANPINRIPLKRLHRAAPIHHRSMPYAAVPSAMAQLWRWRSALENWPWPATLGCLTFMVLTAARPGEARGATWEEIDYEGKVWTIPAGRMKGRREHRVPLSLAARSVLLDANGLSNGKGLIFPNPASGQPLSSNALDDRCEKEKWDCTPHGFRSSFRGFASEVANARWDVAEAALAHKLGDATAQAYARTDLLEARRELMEAWGKFVMPGATAGPFD